MKILKWFMHIFVGWEKQKDCSQMLCQFQLTSGLHMYTRNDTILSACPDVVFSKTSKAKSDGKEIQGLQN